jgi:hypothetical protein
MNLVVMNLVSVFVNFYKKSLHVFTDSDVFEMTLEINDRARQARKIIALPSITPWDALKDRIAQVFNLHPGSMQLQYRFSNEKPNSLPFDLVSLDDYKEMRDHLRPFVVPKILASGKVSKSVRKVVMVHIFAKGTENLPASGEKGKVSGRYCCCFDSKQLIYIY